MGVFDKHHSNKLLSYLQRGAIDTKRRRTLVRLLEARVDRAMGSVTCEGLILRRADAPRSLPGDHRPLHGLSGYRHPRARAVICELQRTSHEGPFPRLGSGVGNEITPMGPFLRDSWSKPSGVAILLTT